MSLTNCRFYEEKYPDIDSFVMVNVYLAPLPDPHLPFSNTKIGQASMSRFP